MSVFGQTKTFPDMIEEAIREHEEKYHKNEDENINSEYIKVMNEYSHSWDISFRLCHCGECDYCVNLDAKDIWGLM